MLIGGGRRLWLEGLVPPPVGAFAGGSGAGWDIGWGSCGGAGDGSCGECCAVTVGDGEVLGGAGDGDQAAVVCPVVIGAEQDQVGQFGGSAVVPVPDVVGVQSAGGPTAGHRAAAVAVLQRPAQPAADRAGHPARPDRLTVAFEPHLAAGITAQILALGVGQQRTQVQGGGALRRGRGGPPRWCAPRVGGGWLRRPSRPRPGAGTPRGPRASAGRWAMGDRRCREPVSTRRSAPHGGPPAPPRTWPPPDAPV